MNGYIEQNPSELFIELLWYTSFNIKQCIFGIMQDISCFHLGILYTKGMVCDFALLGE